MSSGAQQRLLRSPGHEIVAEGSLLSSLASEMNRTGLRIVLPNNLTRGPSPTPEIGRHRLQVPYSAGGGGSTSGSGDPGAATSLWGEEESELIRSCAALSSALGLHKSFSTSDICDASLTSQEIAKPWASDLNLSGGGGRFEVFPSRLDPTSRSCSTWVAVGDVASTSQLPSPQARLGGGESPAITAVDFIRSVNKKVRHNYIKRRLLSTYKAVQRFTQDSGCPVGNPAISKSDAGSITITVPPKQRGTQDVMKVLRKDSDAAYSPQPAIAITKTSTLTARDVERDRGRPLTKYERNMMIFTWLQTLEDSGYDIMT